MIRTGRLIIFASLFLWAGSAFPLTIDEAYEAIPHRRSQYQAAESPVPEREFLAKLFSLSDRALVARIETMQAFSRQEFESMVKYEREVDTVLLALRALEGSGETKELGALLAEAVESQRRYFRSWRDKRTQGDEEFIRSSSAPLHRLYNELITRFPSETEHNKNAFYQHLCALDFR